MELLGKLLVFTILSSIQYISIILAGFSLFRINFKWFKPQIAFVCIALSYVSFTMRIESFALYSPIIQLIILIVSMWLLFRIQIFYAAIVSITGYLVFIILDSATYYIALTITNELRLFTIQMYIVALISGVLTMIVSMLIYRKNWGFSFVPLNEDSYVNYRQKENFLLLFVMIVSAIGLIFVFYFFITFNTIVSFLGTLAFLISAFSILLFLLHRKEYKEALKRMPMLKGVYSHQQSEEKQSGI